MRNGLLAMSTGRNTRADHTRANHRPKLLWKLLCVAYLVALAWLLFSMVPARFIRTTGSEHVWIQNMASVGHFACFFLLTVLVCVSRWGVSRWTIVLGLVACAVVSELLQSQLSQRLSEVGDCVQNLLGVAAGCGFCWLATFVKGSVADHV